ncbi:TraB/GumN family protein [Salipiger mucosus]|uniref:GumN family protein n=1 Tax=Salipiger mucosus DSM 16094 TaxID=1123237 RepID=S9SK68_9RHOB|nr:TraB/GumN family protein [Salipiger mucosus]EPX86764.1 GumN family protein [Salipiger mucosus DSM 16094]
MRHLVLTFLLLFVPGALAAQCAGEDLRATLTGAERDALQAQLADMPHAEGNHWTAERDGEVIHLVGTLHIDDPRLEAVTGRLAPVVADAGRLLLEMTAAELGELQDAMATTPDIMLLSDTTLPELMDEAQWQELSEAVRSYGIPPFMAAKFRPWYLMMLLSTPPCAMEDLASLNGLDARLQVIARENDVPMQALEPWDTAFRALNGASIEDQLAALDLTLATLDMAEDMLATTREAYFDEEHGAVWSLSGVLAARAGEAASADVDAMMAGTAEALLSTRNRAWLPVILEAVEEVEGPVVAAFGAGHLSGEAGVLRLLEEEGFTLTRQPF